MNHPSLRIENGRLIDPATGLDVVQSLLIRDGKIAATGAEADAAGADAVIDASGGLIVPGFIDLYCNLREPGNGQKGSIASETRAAVRGGFTTVCAAPDSSPINDSSAITHLILDVAERDAPIRVLPLGAATKGLSGELLSDMVGLSNAGCVALSNGSAPLVNARVLRRCMAYAKTFNMTLMLHPQNRSLAADGFAHDGLVTARLGLLGIPEVAETASVMEMILLAEETGVRLHLSQLSCARSVEMVSDARARGVPVTADVAMHHLVLTEEALAGFDSRFHVEPPLRSEADRKGLIEGVRSGAISAIVSQHQPHDPAAKNAPLGDTEPGLSSIESVLSMGLVLVENGELDLGSLVRALTTGPAEVLGLAAPGLGKGQVADLGWIDPQANWTPKTDSLFSAGKHAPILNETLKGLVNQVWRAGQSVYIRQD
ncbi:dihydroorotase [Marinobacter nanhaiticus D15-8W]|uniref:Dihydroorotase n=1 Tax=Marinobacter nanhaiticus D15-8W TaxID=626887 RepID=N6WV37_9GAMM|nr:dihydroorotase [Marinobacter nanhaiticus]ENO15446.1 dihydroorotase [Marinobacter nanhaiticus D15-8W]BES73704.1 dihydroorotase [Marinobacter nanhaiticus D15-8W]